MHQPGGWRAGIKVHPGVNEGTEQTMGRYRSSNCVPGDGYFLQAPHTRWLDGLLLDELHGVRGQHWPLDDVFNQFMQA